MYSFATDTASIGLASPPRRRAARPSINLAAPTAANGTS